MQKRRFALTGIAALAAVAALGVSATAATAASAAPAKAAEDNLTGAGSTFVAPLISKWIKEFGGKAGIQINYGPIGSGGGIAAITGRTVDFGTTDAPLTPDQAKACNGCVQIPWALSATAIIYNLKGVKNNLRITGPLLADIYLGNVTKWNDPKLKALNPGVDLPDTDITPVYRSDGSGTSYNITDYLSSVSPTFKASVGVTTQPPFKAGVGARGSSGVTGVVARTDGAITYADVAYALVNRLNFFAVQNRAGKFVLPGIKQITAAASTVTSVPADNAVSIVNPPATNADAYPICTFTYAIVPLKSEKALTVKKWVLYAISPLGQAQGKGLLFVPVPKAVAVAANKTIARVQQG